MYTLTRLLFFFVVSCVSGVEDSSASQKVRLNNVSVSRMRTKEKERSYDICAYRGCTNGKYNTQSRLYRFPQKRDPRLAVWIKNTGNKRLKGLAPSTLRTSGLCEKHFEPECFVGENRRLVRNAVPKVFIETIDISGKTPKVSVTNEVQAPCVTSEEHAAGSAITSPEPLRLFESDSLMRDKSTKTDISAKTPKVPVTNKVQVPCVTSEEYAAGSAITSPEPLRLLESDSLMRDKSEGPNGTPSTSAVRISTGASGTAAANSEFSVSEHVRKYKRVPADYSESDDDNCAWVNIEPAVQSTTPSCERLTEGALQRLTGRLHKEVAHLKNSNMTMKRNKLLYRKTIQVLRRQLRRASARIERLKIKAKKESIEDFLDRHKCTESAARTMIKLQLHCKNAPYSEEEKDLAKQLYYYSASTYKRLRNEGCSFPSESSVRSWLSEVEIKPGFCNSIFEKLAVKISNLPPEERVCVVKFEEMTMKTFEEYCQKFDCIENVVELGSLGRNDERARYVFLFCVDSLNANNPWRQRLAYFLPGFGMKALEIHTLLKECLCRLSDAGAEVVLITCDQSPSNQSLFNSYLKVSVENPLFTIDEKEFLASFNFPHLIKCLLSMFRMHKVLYCKGEVIANYQDIVDAWEYDICSTTSNVLSHITKAHLHPSSFEAMNVKRAFQILSHTFAAAILTAGHDPEGLQSKTWQATAAFVERMNKVIDACNAYGSLCANSAKRPLADKNLEVEKILVDFVQWSADWTVLANAKAKAIKTVPCLKGLPLSVNAIVQSYRKIKNKHPEFEFAAALCKVTSRRNVVQLL